MWRKHETINRIVGNCKKLALKKYKTGLGAKGDSLGIVQEIEFLPYCISINLSKKMKLIKFSGVLGYKRIT